MKKMRIWLVWCMLLLTACGKSDATTESKTVISTEVKKISSETPEEMLPVSEQASKNRAEYEQVFVNGDKIYTCETYEEIEAFADAVVVVETLDEVRQEIFYEELRGHKVISDVHLYTKVQVIQVFKGDLQIGEGIEIMQYMGYDDVGEVFINFTDTTPLQAGEKWMLFLKKQDDGSYCPVCEHWGRYPLPTAFSETFVKEILALRELKLDWVATKTPITIETDEDINPEFYYLEVQEKLYAAETPEDKAFCEELLERYKACTAEIKPEDFGVYSYGLIPLEPFESILLNYEFE